MCLPRCSRGLMRSSNDPPRPHPDLREYSGCVATWRACAARIALLIGVAALSIGTLLSLTQAEEPKQGGKVIHLAEVTCRTFTELTEQEQGIITARLQGLLRAGETACCNRYREALVGQS